MNTTTVAVGSTNVDKINATQNALAKLNADIGYERVFTVLGCEVKSGVRDQPISADEALQGAKNRAKAAMLNTEKCFVGVGIEGGLQIVDGVWFNQAWVVIYDDRGFEPSFSFASSNGVPIPADLMDKIRAGVELSYAVDQLYNKQGTKNAGGWHSVFTRGHMPLQASIEDAILMAFAGLEGSGWQDICDFRF